MLQTTNSSTASKAISTGWGHIEGIDVGNMIDDLGVVSIANKEFSISETDFLLLKLD